MTGRKSWSWVNVWWRKLSPRCKQLTVDLELVRIFIEKMWLIFVYCCMKDRKMRYYEDGWISKCGLVITGQLGSVPLHCSNFDLVLFVFVLFCFFIMLLNKLHLTGWVVGILSMITRCTDLCKGNERDPQRKYRFKLTWKTILVNMEI